MKTTISEIVGVPTRYHHGGEGETTILFLHGVGVSSDSWFWCMRALEREFYVVAPDMLGFGMTGDGSLGGKPPQDAIVDHLVEFVSHLRLRNLLIVGSSFGSHIGCHLYWRLKSLTRGLALVGCGPSLNSPESLKDAYTRSYENGIVALKNPTFETCRRRLCNLVHDPATVPDALAMIQMTIYAFPNALARFEQRLSGLKDDAGLERFDVSRRTHEIDVPTLVVWGAHDNRGNLEQAKSCAARMPAHTFLLYENCGHLPYLEDPPRLVADLKRFVSTLA